MPESPRVVVTRSTHQAAAFSAKLRAAGFTPVEFPTIALQALPSEPFNAALNAINTFDWLIFTSTNAVDFFFQHAEKSQISNLQSLKIAASGSATARKLITFGITADFIPDEFVGEELVAGLGDLRGQRVLLPRSKIGRPKIVDMLRASGAEVVEVALYDTVTAVPTESAWHNLAQGFDAITFTSPSSVRNFLELLDTRPQKFLKLLRSRLATAVIIPIGPITAETVRANNLPVTRIPDTYTLDGMVAALAAHFHEQILESEIGD